MRVRRGCLQGLVGALILAGLGCGSKGKPVKFDGLITYDDEPLGGATVQFSPIDVTRGQPAVGVTDSKGIFRLTTYAPEDGALPGEYKVTVSKLKGDKSSDTVTPPKNKMEGMQLYMQKGKEMAQEKYNAKKWSPIPLIYGGDKSPLKCQV